MSLIVIIGQTSTLAWQLNDETGKLISNNSLIVKPEGFTMPYNSEKVHGISEKALKEGEDLGYNSKIRKRLKKFKIYNWTQYKFRFKNSRRHFRLSLILI